MFSLSSDRVRGTARCWSELVRCGENDDAPSARMFEFGFNVGEQCYTRTSRIFVRV